MQSIWHGTLSEPEYNGKPLRGEIKTDVLVIGGGLAGILCAYRLRQAGAACVLVEGERIGGGITGNTTAKITAQHGLIYDGLIRKKGLERAGEYYESNRLALGEFRKLSERYPCDFEEKTAYMYTADAPEKLEKEQAAYERLHIKSSFLANPPVPVETKGALGMEGQAQFHPLKLLYALAKELELYEHTFVTDVVENKAVTKNGGIKAEHIILATHFPLVNIKGLYFMKLCQHRSYITALENGPFINGMFLDENESGYSFRNYKDYLLIGGGSHRTGKQGGGFDALRGLSQQAYPALNERYAWAAQDCMSLDGAPYIGRHSASSGNLYAATGFNKWGMTGSMVSAMLLTELIVSGKEPYGKLFSPQRSMLSARLFKNIGSSAAGLLSPGKRCPHMGCALKWNKMEKTWDCPCHGSRFDRSGGLINNPATRGIKFD